MSGDKKMKIMCKWCNVSKTCHIVSQEITDHQGNYGIDSIMMAKIKIHKSRWLCLSDLRMKIATPGPPWWWNPGFLCFFSMIHPRVSCARAPVSLSIPLRRASGAVCMHRHWPAPRPKVRTYILRSRQDCLMGFRPMRRSFWAAKWSKMGVRIGVLHSGGPN